MNTTDSISLISRIREKVNRRLILLLEQEGIKGIAPSHGDILYALFSKERLTMADIAKAIGKDKSTVTALIDKLVKLGYVCKERDTEDTRITHVRLTQAGQSLKPIFDGISREVLDMFYGDMSMKERQLLFDLLMKIHNRL